jgi:F-type H+-transporting ATPase subunit epsilon
MNLIILTQEKTLYTGMIKELIAKTVTGEIAILNHHVPLMTSLVAGPLRYITESGQEETIELSGGILEVKPDSSILILVS